MKSMNKVSLPLEDIVITDSFAKTMPSSDKIATRYHAWVSTGMMPGEVVVDGQNRLIDGYAAYLVYRMAGVKTISCLRFRDMHNEADLRRVRKENEILRAKLRALQQEKESLERTVARVKAFCEELTSDEEVVLGA